MPGYIEWLLAFPRAPTGSVSVQVWFAACMAVIQIAASAVGAVRALRIQQEGTKGNKGQPMKVGAEGSMKKEL